MPIPRATTAAWLVIPPLAVNIPLAFTIPSKSSGDVSSRTNITCSPSDALFAASFAVKAIFPTAAPGDAARPCATA